MVDLLLQWNVDDPVSVLETNRNNTIQTWQGNRNPFIDNPFIATKIWGGNAAEDPWGGLATKDEVLPKINIYPIPSNGQNIYISHSTASQVDVINIYDSNGKLIAAYEDFNYLGPIHLVDLPKGNLFVKIEMNGQVITKQVIVQ